MADERYTFSQARTRLEEIVTQVRKKDTSLEKSLDLLEEGVRLANVCTELSDHTEWKSVAGETLAEDAEAEETTVEEAPVEETVADAETAEEPAAVGEDDENTDDAADSEIDEAGPGA